MGLQVLSDRALEGGGSPVCDIAGWLGACVLRAVSVLSFGRDFAAHVRNSVLAWASLAATIRVPPMSDSWLQMRETDDDKHRADL
jgi:hypothetical protein